METTNMKVSELIELLEEQDPDAEVLVMMQQRSPFECALAGVTTRDEIERADREEDDEDDDAEEEPRERGTAKSDVFLVEGGQLRCGSETAWNVAIC
jgi:ribosomal protein L12E/L44/L45/RPP1/RPP2